MPTLSTDLRNKLERTVVDARGLAERAAGAALESLAVGRAKPDAHMTDEQKAVRNHLRARARQLGDGYLTTEARRRDITAEAQSTQRGEGFTAEAQSTQRRDNHDSQLRDLSASAVKSSAMSIEHLVQECAYEHWHRMLFARFLAENHLLIEPEAGVAISLDECKELAKEEKTDLWTLAGRYAQRMLPQIFRADDPVLKVRLAREDELKLEGLVDRLPTDVFTATDSLGWCYQFWQTDEKKRVNESENKIGADELPAVTQLFTEDYMVDFLLDNTLGAWWAGKRLTAEDAEGRREWKSEEQLRQFVSLPGCPWKYLRFVREESTAEDAEERGGEESKSPQPLRPSAPSAVKSVWRPAAGTFDGWPKTVKDLKCMDPCCGSGHFLVAMFERLVALRMAEEGLSKRKAAEAVVRDNIFGLEIDPRCTQIAAFNLALAAWKCAGHVELPAINIACSGLAPNTSEADWLAIAGDNEKLRNGMERLYRLFQKAAVLGSLINPRAGEGDLLVAAFHQLQPSLEKALAQETQDDTEQEMAVTARGLAKAAEILAGQFTLVATNVPYLARGKHCYDLKEFGERYAKDAKTDLATLFLQRALDLCSVGGTTALVSPHNWLFLGSYKALRERLLKSVSVEFLATLGAKSFQTPMWDFNILLVAITKSQARSGHCTSGIDASEERDPVEKGLVLERSAVSQIEQFRQRSNVDARITLSPTSSLGLLSEFVECHQGLATGDLPRFGASFWEVARLGPQWVPWQGTVGRTMSYGGRSEVLLWEDGQGQLHAFNEEHKAVRKNTHLRGVHVRGKRGVLVTQMSNLPAALYTGEHYNDNTTVLLPQVEAHLSAIWTFCSSDDYAVAVRAHDASLKVPANTLGKVPFDLAHWQKVAAEKYPHGLPEPFSSDPTQWLFNGHPKDADQPLHVAVARLLGYQWPRQTGSSFPDCPALSADGLEKYSDDDGIVCIPSVRGEQSGADRLLALLTAAGIKPEPDLDDWLRNSFFDEHCKLFHDRPFVWHIWDGRKRDGFHALVNYHKLADGVKGRRLLEKLTHAYLGDWITRQRAEVKDGKEGADARLAAALALKERLEAIIEGEPPFDIFVRWKSLAKQPIGWEPDINDGVRMNIRPFMASDLPGGKKGAGVLRTKPNIKWEKDRGKEPNRPKDEYPWFWENGAFTGNRVNDVHLTNEEKARAREIFTAEARRTQR